MENAEEILQSLDEFSKMKPKDIPRELEEYLCFVAKTGDPVYQWPLIKCLFREKLVNVITDFYESCPSVDIPPCPNVAAFNYEAMKNFILEKLDTFAAAPFTVQRICELLTTPRKEYNRIDKYMRALEKNILVVSTREPGNRKSTENGENVVNGLESEHVSQEMINSDINVEVEMDESSSWQKNETTVPYAVNETNIILESQTVQTSETVQDTHISESKTNDTATCSSSISTVITTRPIGYIGYTPNITDLIIEPSNITNADADAAPTPTENGESTTENANINLFAMNSEPALATEPPEELKDEDRVPYTKTVEQVESVFVKADCSESAYVRLERDQPLIHIETLAKKDEQLLQIEAGEAQTSEIPIEPEPSVSHIEQQEPTESQPCTAAELETTDDVQQPETTSVTTATVVEPEPSVVQLEPESSFEHTNDSEASVETESSNETTITSTDEVSTANSSDADNQSADADVAESATAVVTSDTSIETVETSSSDDQVSESNLAAEFTVSQTSSIEEEQSAEATASDVEKRDETTMEVDESSVAEVSNTTEADQPEMDTN